jgi:hypothetical protein
VVVSRLRGRAVRLGVPWLERVWGAFVLLGSSSYAAYCPGAVNLCWGFGKIGDGTRWKLPESGPTKSPKCQDS